MVPVGSRRWEAGDWRRETPAINLRPTAVRPVSLPRPPPPRRFRPVLATLRREEGRVRKPSSRPSTAPRRTDPGACMFTTTAIRTLLPSPADGAFRLLRESDYRPPQLYPVLRMPRLRTALPRELQSL